MINYDGYGFVLCMMCPTFCPSPTQLHLTPPYPTTLHCHLTTNTHQHHYHYHTTLHQVSDANNSSTIRAKCLAEHCGGGGGGGKIIAMMW